MPKRANIGSWLDSWEELLELMAAAEMPELIGTRAQRDFLDLVQSTDDSWATSQKISMIAKQEMGEPFMSEAGLIGQFRLYYRQMKPVASTLGNFPVLGNAQQPQPSKDTDKPRQMICPCGDTHCFPDCPCVSPAKRSSGWGTDPDTKKKFDTIRSRGDGSMISAILRSVEVKLVKQAHKSKPQQASFDNGSKTNGRSSNACLQVGATQQPPSLLTRWILDPGSTLHVCNHQNSTWRKLADVNEILAGGQQIPIKEWSEVEITINTPCGTSPIELTWVAYIPRFLTSLVALSRCRTRGIEFDPGRNCVYQNTPKNVVCKLGFKGGHWLMDSDENERPRAEDLWSASAAESVNVAERRRKQAVKPSYTE
jgi:hypothetical protein